MNKNNQNKTKNLISAITVAVMVFTVFTATFHNAYAEEKSYSVSKVAKLIHEKVNKVRAENGLSSLSYDTSLQKVAQYRSDDMASRNYFSHSSPEGKRPSDVAQSMGYNCRNDIGGGRYTTGIGENIYKKSGQLGSEESIAQAAFAGWMKSSGHRANILNGNYDSEAIAFTIQGNSVWVTQNFC